MSNLIQQILDLQFSNLSFWLKDPGINYTDSFVHVHRVHFISYMLYIFSQAGGGVHGD